MARTKFLVSGDQDLSIDRQMWEIKRQIRQKGGSPIDPELVKIALQNISEGIFYQEAVVNKRPWIKSFVVGEIFKHKTGKIPIYIKKNFQNWLLSRQAARTTSIDCLGKQLIKEYLLPEAMRDLEIQEKSGSKPMTEDQLWVVLFLLIIEPELGKKILKYEIMKDKNYIFHVELASKQLIAVTLNMDNEGLFNEWDLDAGVFNRYMPFYYGGFIHLYLVQV
jgi:hypothetical protein